MKKLNEREVDVQEVAPKSLTTEAELLAICKGEYSDKEKWRAASNPCISGETLLALLRSSSQVLRDGAASNPSLTTEILELADLSPNSEAWFYVIDNPLIDLPLLEKVAASCDDPSIKQMIRDRVNSRS